MTKSLIDSIGWSLAEITEVDPMDSDILSAGSFSRTSSPYYDETCLTIGISPFEDRH